MRNVRILYKKTGRMKFVSHLDMNRYIPRLIKVAKVPAKYTEGFNRHLCLTFALPLSLGTVSQYDMFDIKITDDNFNNDMVLKALQENAVEGIEIVSCYEDFMNASLISFALYTLCFKDNCEILDSLQKMLQSRVILATKKGKKGKETEINLADYIRKINLFRNDDSLTVNVVLPAGNTGNINPSLFIDAFVQMGGKKPSVVNITRDMLYTESMDVFK